MNRREYEILVEKLIAAAKRAAKNPHFGGESMLDTARAEMLAAYGQLTGKLTGV